MEPLTYLALGDSYTIGTGLEDPSASFASVIARRLTSELGVPMRLRNPAVNGYTTGDLIREELPLLAETRPGLVSVLIGANDVVQRVNETTYRGRLVEIYDTIGRYVEEPDRVLSLSTPDFSGLAAARPFGGPEFLRERIERFNRLARSEAESRGYLFIDLTALSQASDAKAEWFASDGLHPGPSQHEAIAALVWDRGHGLWRKLQLERWSQAARQVLTAGERWATTKQDAYIGTEHLLLGLFDDPATEEFLRRRGLTVQKVAQTLERVLGANDRQPRPMKIIPTTRVKQVLNLATREAMQAGPVLVEPTHVLKALVLEGEGIAAQMLAEFGGIRRSNVDDLVRRDGRAGRPSP